MAWSLYNQKGEFLEPLKYTNGKSQDDVVREVLDAVEQGFKIIFIKGMCGSGKSALALNIAKEVGRASVVVPVKYLQRQYMEDYTRRMYLVGNRGRVKITIITGRNNHKCLYNSQVNADDRYLPCDIEIKKDNVEILRKYIRENKHVREEDFESVDDIKRLSVAPACKYWSPIVPKEFSYNNVLAKESEKLGYDGVAGDFVILRREHGCGYYEQFLGYVYSDVLIFNSRKYEIENLIGRKPATDVEIIDECDEFLDKLGNERRINLNIFAKRLDRVLKECKKEEMKGLLEDIKRIVDEILQSSETRRFIKEEKILKIRETKILDLFEVLLKNSQILDYEDFEYYFLAAKNFEGLFDDTYVRFSLRRYDEKRYEDGENIVATVVCINLEKRLKQFLDRNKVFVMMSGTLHSEKVLMDVFGVKNFKVIEAETGNNGKVNVVRTGFERNFRYREFAAGNVKREDYLKALQACLKKALKPALVHVNSFHDLPSEEERETYNIGGVMSREKLLELQEKYKTGELLEQFKEGKIDILYSTKCNRGVDLPGEMCRSIVFTKYPFPDLNAVFWRVLKESKPKEFMEFYFDKSRREFLQRVYRGLRSKDDWVNLMSPDLKVLEVGSNVVK